MSTVRSNDESCETRSLPSGIHGKCYFPQMKSPPSSAKTKCSRLVAKSKYERPSPESAIWWAKLFKELETNAAIPVEKKFHVLKEVFPKKLLGRILRLLDVNVDPEMIDPCLTPIQKMIESLVLNLNRSIETFDAVPLHNIMSRATFKEDFVFEEEVAREKEVIKADDKKFKVSQQKKYTNPYLKFFKRRPDRIKIWYHLPPLALEQMFFTNKADYITEQIAKSFVDRMKELFTADGIEPVTVTPTHIIRMFDLLFNNEAATTLSVRMKEIATIPNEIATMRHTPKLARRYMLFQQIHRDLQAAKWGKKLVAFNTTLPPDLQVHPPGDDLAGNWLVCQNVPEKLRTMATVFEGITDLKSTRAFCEYLLDHPNLKQPLYLKQMGLLNRDVLNAPQYSLHLDDSS